MTICVSCDNGWTAFVPDSFKILKDNYNLLQFQLNENTFDVANKLFKMDELWNNITNPDIHYNLNNYRLNCTLTVQGKDMKFDIYDAYMIYHDKYNKFNCTFCPNHMKAIIY